MPRTVAMSKATIATAPKIPFCLPCKFLSVNINITNGRKATTAMIAPSWFWTKNLNLSFVEAGSRRFAFFQSSDPATASARSTTMKTISHTILTGGRFKRTIAPTSAAMAITQSNAATRRRVDARPLLSAVGVKTRELSDAICPRVEFSSILVTLFDVPLVFIIYHLSFLRFP